MRNSKTCPKCGSKDVVWVELPNDIIPIGIFDRAQIERYVCCECGYTEEWVRHTDNLRKLYKNWK